MKEGGCLRSAVEIGEYIRAQLKAIGVTNRDFLTKCKLNSSFLVDLKNGSMPSIDKLDAVAMELGSTIDELVNGGGAVNGQKNSSSGEPETPVISSVSKFIAAVVEASDKHSYFRGEGSDYGDNALRASAFRPPYNGLDNNIHKFYWNYYRRIYLGLSEDERGGYLAIARHHGLSVNILDITVDPLVALYFACDSSRMTDGVVYCFSDDFIDITNTIREDGLDVILSPIEYVWKHNKSLQHNFEVYFNAAEKQTARKHFERLVDFLLTLENVWQLETFKNVGKSYARLYDNEQMIHDILFPKNKRPDKECILKHLCAIDNPMCGRVYFDIFYELSVILENHAADKLSELFNLLPRMLYRPLISTTRHIMQNSSYIYQWNYFNAQQTVRSDDIRRVHIAAEAKMTILEELDALGINIATIYADRDNIAKYSMGEKHKVEMVPATKLAQLEERITLLDEKQTSLAAELAKSNERISDLETQNANLKNTLSQRDAQITKLENEATQRDRRIADLEKENAELKRA
jgi:transcriptional regulator with XRE-family HTH domain